MTTTYDTEPAAEPALDPRFADMAPFHAACVWYRLSAAVTAVHGATGDLHHPIIEQLEQLQDQAWGLVYDRCDGAERERVLKLAREWVEENR